MPSLANRTDHETRLAGLISGEFDRVRAAATANPASVDYETFERDLQKELAEALAIVYLLAWAGMESVTRQHTNRYVAIARSSEYGNERAATLAWSLSADIREKINAAAFKAAQSVADGVSPNEARQRYEAELATILSAFRAETIAITEITAAHSAGEFAIGKPDASKHWLALLYLYGLDNAIEAWTGFSPSGTIRDLIGRPNYPADRQI